MKISVGQIWEVVTDKFSTSGQHNEYKRPILLKKGERIEIRYPYEWHFRTEDGKYLHATPDMITENCKLFGVILTPVKFGNKANLEEILRLGLYDKQKRSSDN